MRFRPNHTASARPAPDSPTSAHENRALLGRLVRLAWSYRRRCLTAIFGQAILLALGLGGLAISGLGIDILRHHRDLSQVGFPLGFRPPPNLPVLAVLGGLAAVVLGLSFFRTVLSYAVTVFSGRLVQDVIVDLRVRLYEKFQQLSFRYHDTTESGATINRMTTDVHLVRQFIDGVVIQGSLLLLTLIVDLTYMLRIHAGLTAACLATTPLLWGMTRLYARRVRPQMLVSRELYDRMVRVLSENVQGVHVVKGFGREPEEAAKFAAANRAVSDQQRWIFRATSLYSSSMGMLTNLNLVILVGLGSYLVMRGHLALGSGLMVFYGLLNQFSAQVGAISNVAHGVQQSLTGARRVFDVLDTPIEIRNPLRPQRIPRVRGALSFESVTFGYLPNTPVLHDISFQVEPGARIALMGPTGAGKSTLLHLIPRFYDPGQGTIRLDSIDLRDLHLDDLRRNIGVVFQETFLFSHTVSANIAFGNPRATREQIEQAARAAAAHEFIQQLEGGYDHVLGERGSGLSGGQRQRLALARAVLLNPALLLLDDATAAIDPQTEREIEEAMESIMRGRTTLRVTHRLGALRRADLILVLRDGRIIQRGTHDSLMAETGYYRETALLQMAADEEGAP